MTANAPGYDAAYRAAHLERMREQGAARQRAFRERLRAAELPTRTDADRERDRAAYAEDPERVKARALAWQQEDKRRTAAAFANAKARRLGLPGRLDWRLLPDLPQPCTYCGAEAWGFDHVIPMGKGGPNTHDNVVPCCLPCNERKNDGPVSRVAVA